MFSAWIRALITEHQAMLLRSEAVRKQQELRDGSPAGAHPSHVSESSEGGWSFRTASLLWDEMLTMPAKFVLPASVAAVCQYWLAYQRANVQGRVLDVFAAVGHAHHNGTSLHAEAGSDVGILPFLTRILAVFCAWTDGWVVLRHLFGIMIADWLCGIVRSYMFAEAWAARKLHSRVRLFANVLIQDATWFDSQNSAALATRVQRDPEALDDLVINTLERGFRGAAALALLYHLIHVEPFLTAFAILLRLPQVLQLVERGVRIATAYERLQAHTLMEAQSRAVEAISNARLVQVNTAECVELKAYAAALAVHTQTVRASALAVTALRHAEGVLLVATEVLLLCYGGYRILQGKLSLGTFTAYRLLVSDFIDRFHGLEELYRSVRRAALLSKRYFSLRDRVPAIPLTLPRMDGILNALKGVKALQTLPGAAESTRMARKSSVRALSLTLEHISFKYAGHDMGNTGLVLTDVHVAIPAGAFVAVVGASGCGKSTLSRLLLRLYDPTSGSIKLGGKDLREWDVRELRRTVGLVDQEAALLNRSVADNIALGSVVEDEYDADDSTSSIHRNDIIAAAKKANAHEFITELPQGYDTVVGERGSRLSGGQRQRLAIARAILRNPAVLVLDEATAALDSVSELAVTEALSTLMRGRTTIMIAHRLSTIKRADTIVVLDGGRIVECGSHASLMGKGNKNGVYCRFIQHSEAAQSGGVSTIMTSAVSPSTVLRRRRGSRSAVKQRL